MKIPGKLIYGRAFGMKPEAAAINDTFGLIESFSIESIKSIFHNIDQRGPGTDSGNRKL